MDDASVRAKLDRIDELLERLEQAVGPTAEAALQAISLLTGVYGEALNRIVQQLAGDPALAAGLAADELVGHLLILHGIHPHSAAERIEAALEGVRPYVHGHGGEVTLAGIEGGVARVRLSGSCQGCASSAATLEGAVRDAVLAAAPELDGVEVMVATADAGQLIPVDSLRHKIAAPGVR